MLTAMPRPEASLWSRVQANRRDEAYMLLTGLPVAEFDRLATDFHLQYIEEVQRRKPVGTSNRGRPRNCSSSDVLALTLAYLRDGLPDKHRQAAFGIPRSCLSRMQELGLVVLFNTLSLIREALVSWPWIELGDTGTSMSATAKRFL